VIDFFGLRNGDWAVCTSGHTKTPNKMSSVWCATDAFEAIYRALIGVVVVAAITSAFSPRIDPPPSGEPEALCHCCG